MAADRPRWPWACSHSITHNIHQIMIPPEIPVLLHITGSLLIRKEGIGRWRLPLRGVHIYKPHQDRNPKHSLQRNCRDRVWGCRSSFIRLHLRTSAIVRAYLMRRKWSKGIGWPEHRTSNLPRVLSAERVFSKYSTSAVNSSCILENPGQPSISNVLLESRRQQHPIRMKLSSILCQYLRAGRFIIHSVVGDNLNSFKTPLYYMHQSLFGSLSWLSDKFSFKVLTQYARANCTISGNLALHEQREEPHCFENFSR